MLQGVLSTIIGVGRAGDLLRVFVRRDLNARYKGSALGIVWSLLNPLLMMVVYTIVFSQVMRVAVDDYPVFFMSGFLPWLFFSTSLQMGSFSLLGHAALIQKVYFPRAVLPLSIVVANLVNVGIAFAVFLPYAIYQRGFHPSALVALTITVLALALATAGLASLLSVAMVYFRDIEFLLGIGLTAWFFLTPIVYRAEDVPERFAAIFRVNPILPYVEATRDALYDGVVPPAGRIAACLVIGVVVLLVSSALFARFEPRVAEEL